MDFETIEALAAHVGPLPRVVTVQGERAYRVAHVRGRDYRDSACKEDSALVVTVPSLCIGYCTACRCYIEPHETPRSTYWFPSDWTEPQRTGWVGRIARERS